MQNYHMWFKIIDMFNSASSEFNIINYSQWFNDWIIPNAMENPMSMKQSRWTWSEGCKSIKNLVCLIE